MGQAPPRSRGRGFTSIHHYKQTALPLHFAVFSAFLRIFPHFFAKAGGRIPPPPPGNVAFARKWRVESGRIQQTAQCTMLLSPPDLQIFVRIFLGHQQWPSYVGPGLHDAVTASGLMEAGYCFALVNQFRSLF